MDCGSCQVKAWVVRWNRLGAGWPTARGRADFAAEGSAAPHRLARGTVRRLSIRRSSHGSPPRYVLTPAMRRSSASGSTPCSPPDRTDMRALAIAVPPTSPDHRSLHPRLSGRLASGSRRTRLQPVAKPPRPLDHRTLCCFRKFSILAAARTAAASVKSLSAIRSPNHCGCG